MKGRSVAAVLAGLAAVVILSTVTDAVLHSTGVFPPSGTVMSTGQFLAALAYRTAFGVAGGYITARLAPDRPIPHALALGAIGLVLGMAGAAATWNYQRNSVRAGILWRWSRSRCRARGPAANWESAHGPDKRRTHFRTER